ncbi:MAG: hypothetical protein KGI89_06815, partial [Euryarchaeota archaeon]|nr:hypothetical protein [Euryarchaeota archaeon]
EIRAALRSNGIEPSDRRFKQSVGVLKAYAYLGGRDVVGMDDLASTRYMLWTTPEQEAKVAQEVLRVASPMLGRIEDIHDDVMRHFAEAQSAAAKDEGKGKKAQIFVEWLARTKTQVDEVADLIAQMKREGRDPTRAEQLLKAIETKRQAEIQGNLGNFMSKSVKKG